MRHCEERFICRGGPCGRPKGGDKSPLTCRRPNGGPRPYNKWVLAMTIGIAIIFASSAIAAPVYPPSKPQARYYVGEKLVYAISYLGISVGTAQAEVKEILEIRGRKAYHIQVQVQSSRWLDWFYKVRDEHHSYVDVETLASLGYEKKIHEGPHQRYEKIEFEMAPPKKVRYVSSSGKLLQEIPLSEGMLQDPLSCGYWTRTLNFNPESSVNIPVHAEGKNWNLEVRFFEKAPIDMHKIGSFEAVRTRPLMEFQGIFIRKGQIEGWISLDARRIPLRMKVKIPVLGSVHAGLKDYYPGKS